MTFGQILDRMFQLVRANLRLLLGIALVPAAGFIAYLAILLAAFFPIWKAAILNRQPPHLTLATIAWGAVAYLIGAILMIVIVALYEPAAVYAALALNNGTRVAIREAWAAACGKAGRYIWLSFLRMLIVAVPILVIGAVVVGSMGLSLARGRGSIDPSITFAIVPLIVLLYLGAIVYAVLALLRLVLAVPACVAEGVSAWTAIRRSNQLTSGAKGRIFLLALVIYAIAYAAFLVVEMIFFFLGAMAGFAGMLLHLKMDPWGYIGIGAAILVFLCIYLLWYACIWAAYTTVFAVVYQDQRLRLEGISPAAQPG